MFISLQRLSEPDRNRFKPLHLLAIERFCTGVLKESVAVIAINEGTTHERYSTDRHSLLLNSSSMRIPWLRAGQYDVRKVTTLLVNSTLSTTIYLLDLCKC